MSARLATIQLARFDRITPAPAPPAQLPEGVLFAGTGADIRAAGTEPTSAQGFVLLQLGLHATPAAARQFLEQSPWSTKPLEEFQAILSPYHHKGEANFLGPVAPLFEELEPAPAAPGPVCVLTSVGWNTENFDIRRAQEFGAGVNAIRNSMTGLPHLHSQQSFFLQGGLRYDPLTLTFWRNEQALTQFAYARGPHRHQMDKQEQLATWDRGSFSRLVMLETKGSWYGSDPATF